MKESVVLDCVLNICGFTIYMDWLLYNWKDQQQLAKFGGSLHKV